MAARGKRRAEEEGREEKQKGRKVGTAWCVSFFKF